MRAVFWMLGAIASFCLMAIAARELDGKIDKFELLAIRSLVGFVLLVIIMNVIKRPTLMFSRRMKTHFWRNFFHFIGQFSWLVGIGLLPLAQVFAIEFTVPLWVLIIASIFLSEAITRRKLVSVALGLIGVAVIVKPGVQIIDVGGLVMIIASLCFAVTFILSKSLLTTEHPRFCRKLFMKIQFAYLWAQLSSKARELLEGSFCRGPKLLLANHMRHLNSIQGSGG